jgi:hypothetical protein
MSVGNSLSRGLSVVQSDIEAIGFECFLEETMHNRDLRPKVLLLLLGQIEQ